MRPPNPEFHVLKGPAITRLLDGRENKVLSIIEKAYFDLAEGKARNPPTFFLRFPESPTSRITGLAAVLDNGRPLIGMKWISSFPSNHDLGLPRASAVLILNDGDTGYPLACLEGSIISAARTAASAALGARWISGNRKASKRLGIIGTGLIARTTLQYLVRTGWQIAELALFDRHRDRAERFASGLDRLIDAPILYADSASELIRGSDLIILATTAPQPYIDDPASFHHSPVVLNISLRDLGVDVILSANNVVDDIDHCLAANTSPHLAERKTGSRAFINGSLVDLISGRCALDPAKPTIFSPFGLGVLDLALGSWVLELARELNTANTVSDFFDTPTAGYASLA